VDSGATYTLVTQDVCKAPALTHKPTATFRLADGRPISVFEGHHLQLPQGDGHTPVLHPFKLTFERMRMPLA
jgi:hypothetical protein